MRPEVQPLEVAGRCSSRNGHEVLRGTGLRVVVVDQGELDGHQLDEGLGYHQNQDEDLLAGRNLQFVEDVLENEGHLGPSPVQQEQPGQEGQVEDAQNDRDDVVAHGVPEQADDLDHLTLETHAPEDQPVEGRDGHAEDVEDAQTGADDRVGVGEVCGVALVLEEVVDGAADEHHGRIDPEGAVAEHSTDGTCRSRP